MTSYIFNSKSDKLTRRKLLKLYGLTLVLVGAGFLVSELAVRYHFSKADARRNAEPVAELMVRLPDAEISDRELGNQMIAQNVALFDADPAPAQVTAGYVGTSRSKILQPSRLGEKDSVVGAGNSYNEISYGLILQGEILRLRFPNLKTLYVETSLLLRRPDAFAVEPDHLKYMPLLLSLQPLCTGANENNQCAAIFAGTAKPSRSLKQLLKPQLSSYRSQIRLSSLFSSPEQKIHAKDDPFLKKLTPRGERRDTMTTFTAAQDMVAETKPDNVKVQRLRGIPGTAPWDGLFDMYAKWGQAHNIQVVFYQPPVRSDLYAFQKQFGLAEHVKDLKRISTKYKLPFIDLDTPEVGLMQDWSLFSDEDHMGTCKGSTLMMLAIEDGVNQFKTRDVLEPVIQRSVLDQKLNASGICKEN